MYNGWSLLHRLPGGHSYVPRTRNRRLITSASGARHASLYNAKNNAHMREYQRATVTRDVYEWRGARSVTATIILPHLAHTMHDAIHAGLPVRSPFYGSGAENRVTIKHFDPTQPPPLPPTRNRRHAYPRRRSRSHAPPHDPAFLGVATRRSDM